MQGLNQLRLPRASSAALPNSNRSTRATTAGALLGQPATRLLLALLHQLAPIRLLRPPGRTMPRPGCSNSTSRRSTCVNSAWLNVNLAANSTTNTHSCLLASNSISRSARYTPRHPPSCSVSFSNSADRLQRGRCLLFQKGAFVTVTRSLDT